MKTKTTQKKEIKRSWHLFDIQGKILGRISNQIAGVLLGKDKPYFVPHLDCGDYAVVINAAKVKVTGKKEEQKKYYRHSGYPGGFRETTFKEQLAKDPRQIIYHAVQGMLPKNKLQSRRLLRLKIFSAENHSYQDKNLIIHLHD